MSGETRRGLAITCNAAAVLAFIMLAQPAKAADGPNCQIAEGHLTLNISTAPPVLSAHAVVTGNVSGTYDLTVSLAELVPTSQPAVDIFTGTSVINTRHGDVLHFAESGTADFGTGNLSVYWKIVSGSTFNGKAASGHMFFVGHVTPVSPAESLGEGDIRGEICTP